MHLALSTRPSFNLINRLKMLFSRLACTVALLGAVAHAQRGGNNQGSNNNGANNQANNAAANNNNGGGDEATSTTLAADAIQSGSFSDGSVNGQSAAGQAKSATSKNNFINNCAGKTLTNGLQVQGGSCNGIRKLTSTPLDRRTIMLMACSNG